MEENQLAVRTCQVSTGHTDHGCVSEIVPCRLAANIEGQFEFPVLPHHYLVHGRVRLITKETIHEPNHCWVSSQY